MLFRSVKEIRADETTPCFRNIYVKNLVSRNARRAMFFNGLPEMNLSNINVENATISAKLGAEIVESDGINFKNVTIIPTQGPAFSLNNVKNFSASELNYPSELKQPFFITGDKTKNISLPLKIENKNGVLLSEKINKKEIVFKK